VKKLILLFVVLFFIGVSSAALSDNVARWKFDENGGTTAVDSVASWDMTVENNWFTPGTRQSETSAINSSATNDDFGMTLSGNTTFTINAWVYRTGDPLEAVTSTAIFSTRAVAATANGEFVLNFMNATTTRFSVYVPGSVHAVCGHMTPNVWTMVTAVYNSTDALCYKDGILFSSASGAWTGSAETIHFLGDTDGGNLKNAVIDEARIWQTALVQSDIQFLFGQTVLQSPDDNATLIQDTVQFNITSLGDVLSNVTLYVWNSTGVFNTSFRTITGTVNNTVFSVPGFKVGKYQYNAESCSSVCSSATNNRSFDWGYNLSSETYSTPVGDLSNTSFTLNITIDDSVNFAEASLWYNGTLYTATKIINGFERFFTRVVDIPAVVTSTVRDFNWIITLQDTFFENFNTTTKQQTVVPSTLGACTGSNTETVVNYTFFDEGDQTSISADMDVTFNWSLAPGGVSKNASFSLTGERSYAFCINLNDTFFVDVDMELSSTGYSQRVFSFNNEVWSNETTFQPLYLLNTSAGTDFILRLKDLGLRPLEGYEIKIFRKLPSGGAILVENDVTDFLGQVTPRLIENDVRYRLLFYNPNDVLVKIVEDAYATCTTSICTRDFVLTDDTNIFSQFDDLTEHTFDLTFDNTTREFNFVWVDNRGEGAVHRLLVEQKTFSNGTVVVFNGTSSSSSGVLTYTAPDTRATYTAIAFRLVDGVDTPLGSPSPLNVEVGDMARTYGLEGLYWSAIFFMAILLIMRFSPPWGVIMYIMGSILLGMMDIIFINLGIIIAEIVIGAIFIWAWRG